jgi:hypothetical protein
MNLLDDLTRLSSSATRLRKNGLTPDASKKKKKKKKKVHTLNFNRRYPGLYETPIIQCWVYRFSIPVDHG